MKSRKINYEQRVIFLDKVMARLITKGIETPTKWLAEKMDLRKGSISAWYHPEIKGRPNISFISIVKIEALLGIQYKTDTEYEIKEYQKALIELNGGIE